MMLRNAMQTIVCIVTGTLTISPLLAQPEADKKQETEQSVVLKAKQVSKLTGRPILAIAGSNT